MEPTSLLTFGDARRLILQTIVDLRQGKLTPATAMAVAANMKVLNDSVQTEINAAKLSLATEGKAHSFGRVVGLGQRLLGNESGQDA